MSDLRVSEAVKAKNIDAVRELVESGGDVNEQDEQGWTPLNWAAGKGDVEMVQLLVEKGADVFKTGRDLRRPYHIALAANHLEVAKLLKAAEEKANPEADIEPQRQYCKAYYLEQLRQFNGWTENKGISKQSKSDGSSDNGAGSEQGLSGDDIAYIHQDLTVTLWIWQHEDVVFDQVSDQWKEFCTNVLNFRVPDDIDLASSAQAVESENPL